MTGVPATRNAAGGPALPALIAEAGKGAARRFIEFFTVNIRNRNARATYARAAGEFLRWCEGQGFWRSLFAAPAIRGPCGRRTDEPPPPPRPQVLIFLFLPRVCLRELRVSAVS